MANIKQSPVHTNTGFNRTSVTTDGLCITKRTTWKDKDEEGTDASDDADDLADVWYEHGNEQCHRYPQHCQCVSAAAFELHCHRAAAIPPPAEQQVLYH